jgi:hypothetical protein
VDVDEAGGDELAAGVDLLGAAAGDLADLDDPAVGDRSTTANACPGSRRSSPNRPCPVRNRRSSTRSTLVPTSPVSMASAPAALASAPSLPGQAG